MPDQPRFFAGFVAGTPVLTTDGIKPIEDIKPGDIIQVHADDEAGARDDKGIRWW